MNTRSFSTADHLHLISAQVDSIATCLWGLCCEPEVRPERMGGLLRQLVDSLDTLEGYRRCLRPADLFAGDNGIVLCGLSDTSYHSAVWELARTFLTRMVGCFRDEMTSKAGDRVFVTIEREGRIRIGGVSPPEVHMLGEVFDSADCETLMRARACCGIKPETLRMDELVIQLRLELGRVLRSRVSVVDTRKHAGGGTAKTNAHTPTNGRRRGGRRSEHPKLDELLGRPDMVNETDEAVLNHWRRYCHVNGWKEVTLETIKNKRKYLRKLASEQNHD